MPCYKTCRSVIIHVRSEVCTAVTKGLTSSLLPSPASPPPMTPAWSLPIGPVQSLPHSIMTGPFLQTSLPAILYNPSESQHHHFSSEYGDSTLLRNAGFYQPVHTAPKPRRTSSITYVSDELSYSVTESSGCSNHLLMV
jgi:hypothetical protein